MTPIRSRSSKPSVYTVITLVTKPNPRADLCGICR